MKKKEKEGKIMKNNENNNEKIIMKNNNEKIQKNDYENTNQNFVDFSGNFNNAIFTFVNLDSLLRIELILR